MAGYPLVDLPPERVEAGIGRHSAEPGRGALARWLVLAALLGGHAWLCLASMGGVSQVLGPWPPAWHDHPMHYHNAIVARSFLIQNGTTAGYDPYFMAGYAKSIVSDPSGTLIEVVVAAFGGDRPAVAYKLLILAIMAGLPGIVSAAIGLLGGRPDAVLAGTTAFLLYLWTDYPLEYAGLGMTAFLLVVPASLLGLVIVVSFLERGGLGRWAVAAVASAALLLIHPLAGLVVAPSAAVSYAIALRSIRRAGGRFPRLRHLGFWALPALAVAANVFWWSPALTLAATRDTEGPDFFSHQEPVWERIAQVFGLANPVQSPIQVVVLGGAAIGLAALARKRPAQGLGLATFLASGLVWGYLAGGVRGLDFLQPGRWTFAAYSAGAVATGLGWSAMRVRLARGPGRLDRWAAVAVVLVGFRLFAPMTNAYVAMRTGRELVTASKSTQGGGPSVRLFPPTGRPAFLSSAPAADTAWMISRIREHFEPGDRILYEEGGRKAGDLVEPFGGRRLGGLLPSLTGVEVIGGPFLHVPVRENYTQFGMGRLCGMEDWTREGFERLARLYGPEGIVCWSPKVRAFCRQHPDLFEIVVDREPILMATIRGFGGDAIRGQAEVEASAGRLTVRPIAADVDGLIVLRYHSVPGLRSDPPGPLRAVEMPGDPVPFIALDSPEGPVTIEWDAPP